MLLILFWGRTSTVHAEPVLNHYFAQIPEKGSFSLSVQGAGSERVRFASMNTAIAKVSSTGIVTGVSKGNTYIMALVGSTHLVCRVRVGSFTLNRTALVMLNNRSLALQAMFSNIKSKVVWRSSAPDVVSVDVAGKITSKSPGIAVIRAYCMGTYRDCRIKVEQISLSRSSLSLSIGGQVILSVRGTSAQPVWSSSDPDIVSVTANGGVTARRDGTAILFAKVRGVTLRCYVTVKSTTWDRLLYQYRSDPKTKQLVFVRYTGGSSAIVELYTKKGSSWTKAFSCSGEVGQLGIGTAREGSAVTPQGVYNLTSGFGISPNPGTRMPYVRVNQYLYWCGDRQYYNRLIDIREYPHDCEGEHLIEYSQCYEYGMFFNYNKENIYGKGSAFFLHVKGNAGYTLGCVAVSRSDMIRLLLLCETGAKICIYPY